MKKMNTNPVVRQLKTRLRELAYLASARALLHWDQETYMPKKGVGKRAETIAYLTGLLHEKFLAKDFEELLLRSKAELEEGRLGEMDAAIVRETFREFEIEQKLPLGFVKELARVTSGAQSAWVEAREKSDFSAFRPHLERVVALKQKEANYLGYPNSPYDALLDLYEPGATTAEISVILQDVKKFLVPFIEKIVSSGVSVDPKMITGRFPRRKQERFIRFVLERLGFDFDAGRMDVSAHPFSIGFHPYDTRITTRFDERNLISALFGAIHEAGHALYEQGLPMENFGTPLGESVSLGIHESQSRMWENMVGRCISFWTYFYPRLQKEFPKPFAGIPLQNFYSIVNAVRPSFIRVEADEVTYNLHIILRFEIEKEIIEGTIEVKDLPEVWNAKFKDYFGLTVSKDSDGVLQDVHWSQGSIGYFPTYTLGNLYAAQFYAAARRNILSLDKEISLGEFGLLREWLRKNIHIHGKLYRAKDLVKEATGEPLTAKYFTDYLMKKYEAIYGLK